MTIKECRNLGRALTIVAKAHAKEVAMHVDVDVFHAPSECHTLVARGEARRLRQARRHAESVCRAPWRVIQREAFRRCGGKPALQRAEQRLAERLTDKALGR